MRVMTLDDSLLHSILFLGDFTPFLKLSIFLTPPSWIRGLEIILLIHVEECGRLSGRLSVKFVGGLGMVRR